MATKSGFYKTLTADELAEHQATKVWLDDRYQVEWSNDSSFFHICEDEDSRKPITRHLDTIIGVLRLEHGSNQGRFITIGADNSIQVSLNQGSELFSIDGFPDRIIGVQEFTNGSLAVVTDDGTFTLCNMRSGKRISEIDANIQSLDDLLIMYRERAFFVLTENGAAIWAFDGTLIVTLKGIKSSLNRAIRLNSQNWLIWTEDGKFSLWSNQGHVLKEFDFLLDNENDFVELEDNHILFKYGKNQVSLHSAKGEKLHTHSASQEVDSLFNDLTRNRANSTSQMESKPDIDSFIHYRNFFASKNNRFIPKDEFASQELELPANSERRKVWDFFIRPDTWQLRTVLKDVVKRSRTSEKTLGELTEKAGQLHEAAKGKAATQKTIAILFLTIAGAAGLFGSYGLSNPGIILEMYSGLGISVNTITKATEFFAFLPAGITLFLSILFANKLSASKKAIKKHTSNLEVLKMLLGGHKEVIANIKNYRRGLISQIPVLQPGQENIFSGEFISGYINNMLNGKLKRLAMQECGIEEEDIVFRDNEAIILPSWSLIQDSHKRSVVANKIPFNNEFAVRIIKGGAMVSAVQFIQYIFLTKDKIDVFTMYYDFITDKAVGKEANAFFYKDVTNIGKKDVDRHGWLSNDNSNGNDIAATDIILSVSSGEKISLTILNEDSISKINKQTKDIESISPEMEVKRLEKEKQSILSDTSMPQDEKDDELQAIELRMKYALAAQQQVEIEEVTNKAEDAIKNIRNQLKQHKKE